MTTSTLYPVKIESHNEYGCLSMGLFKHFKTLHNRVVGKLLLIDGYLNEVQPHPPDLQPLALPDKELYPIFYCFYHQPCTTSGNLSTRLFQLCYSFTYIPVIMYYHVVTWLSQCNNKRL